MANENRYSRMGFTIQKMICDKYNIKPNSRKAETSFLSGYDEHLVTQLRPFVDVIFSTLGHTPVECTTDDSEAEGTYNFILDDETTLSLRTNFNGDKIAPRVVGQAGYEVLNRHFAKFHGSAIIDKSDIKEVMFNNIHKVLPIFIENLFDADHIVWVHFVKDKIKVDFIEGNTNIALDFSRGSFSFTCDLKEWNESTTVKYKETSIAEIQIHKNRTFKFRFIMKNLAGFFKDFKETNETLGMTAEMAICNIFGLECPPNVRNRGSFHLERLITPSTREAFRNIPTPVRYTGEDKGLRGGASKCSYDFLLEGDRTLSVKTNKDRMVCPPEVGQPCASTCYLYFGALILEDHIDGPIFKRMVYEHIGEMIKIYLEHLFDSDYLLRICKNPSDDTRYDTLVVEKGFGSDYEWDIECFSFSKQRIEDWKESNTLYYGDITLGEFQVHNHRDCYKFRFNFDNLLLILNGRL